MSTDANTDKFTDDDLFGIEHDNFETGAAADSSEPDEWLKTLPRLLRYAMLVANRADHIDRRLAAEIESLCPDLALNTGWLTGRDRDNGSNLGTALGLLLAAELDRRAVGEDRPDLRSLADCVRLLSLPGPAELCHFGEHRRVAKSLLLASETFTRTSPDEDLCSQLERFCFGWAALPCCGDLLGPTFVSAVDAAVYAGARMT